MIMKNIDVFSLIKCSTFILGGINVPQIGGIKKN